MDSLTIQIITPVPSSSRKGNRVTAERWKQFFVNMNHSVTIEQEWTGNKTDVFIALHARKSGTDIQQYARTYPDQPILLCLTGSDLYRDLGRFVSVQKSIDQADRLIVLQERAPYELDPSDREKTHVIYQSVGNVPDHDPSDKNEFRVCVVGHLRSMKDPFRAARAARWLPDHSRVRILHIGGVLEDGMGEVASNEAIENDRYTYLGEKSREKTLEWMATSHLLVHSSYREGGAHVLSEAIAIGLPVIASEIPGNIGMLGEHYSGYYPAGDTRSLASMLETVEEKASFRHQLQTSVQARQKRVRPETERDEWKKLLTSLDPGKSRDSG